MKWLVFIFLLMTVTNLNAQDSLPPPIDTQITNPVPPRVPVRQSPRIRQNQEQSIIRTDSLPITDTIIPKATPGRSEKPITVMDSVFIFPSWRDPAPRTFYRFTDPLEYSITLKKWVGKEAIFYSIVALLMFFAVIKNSFYRYIQDLFKIFFRTTVKQRQIREQLLQSPLPSFLLNIFFLLTIGMFIALLLQYFNLATEINFWLLFSFCILGLIGIYGVKYLSLKLLGWIFQVSEVIDGYIFIVFTTNKIIGMALLPFLVILAFSGGLINEAAMNLSILVVLSLFAYRFFLSYVSIRRQVKISFFHFFLYLCAFEVAPLLLINKLLFRFLGETS